MTLTMPTMPVPETPTVPSRILLVEDDESAGRHLRRLLQESTPHQVDTVRDGEAAVKKLANGHYDVLLTDLCLPGLDGMELIRAAHRHEQPPAVVVLTGEGGIEEAVEALQLGAFDFLTKPIDLDHLKLVLQRSLYARSLRDEVARLRSRLREQPRFHNILSRNPRMHALFELTSQIARTNTTVLIEGETGTGKEQLARAIHLASTRHDAPLVAINCAALPESLLESELFGHEKGAFTNAIAQRTGRFEMADGGTLFLDEVGDIPAAMQAKLLRVLQERQFERVGGTDTIHVDVRVVAATNRSLQQLVKKGTFREDLYYRLNVVKMELPPLRERIEDVPLLAEHFAARYSRPGEPEKTFSKAAMEVLTNHGWPGNIRELENAVQRACVTTSRSVIAPDNLPQELGQSVTGRSPLTVDLNRPLPELTRELIARVEQQYLRKALRKVQGHVGKCAKLAGVSRRSVTSKIADYRIDRHEFRA